MSIFEFISADSWTLATTSLWFDFIGVKSFISVCFITIFLFIG
jgi:hypothetical protein